MDLLSCVARLTNEAKHSHRSILIFFSSFFSRSFPLPHQPVASRSSTGIYRSGSLSGLLAVVSDPVAELCSIYNSGWSAKNNMPPPKGNGKGLTGKKKDRRYVKKKGCAELHHLSLLPPL